MRTDFIHETGAKIDLLVREPKRFSDMDILEFSYALARLQLTAANALRVLLLEIATRGLATSYTKPAEAKHEAGGLSPGERQAELSEAAD